MENEKAYFIVIVSYDNKETLNIIEELSESEISVKDDVPDAEQQYVEVEDIQEITAEEAQAFIKPRATS